MEELDLKKLWRKANTEAKEYYEEIAPDIERKAQRKSHDILERVRKNIIIELWASAIATVLFPLLFLNNWILFITSTILIGLAMDATAKVYLGYLREIKGINDDNLVNTLKKKIDILGGWIKRVKIIMYLFSVLGFYYGMFISAVERGETFTDIPAFKLILIELAITLPFLALFLWFCNRYLYWMYGKKLKALKEVLEGLKQ